MKKLLYPSQPQLRGTCEPTVPANFSAGMVGKERCSKGPAKRLNWGEQNDNIQLGHRSLRCKSSRMEEVDSKMYSHLGIWNGRRGRRVVVRLIEYQTGISFRLSPNRPGYGGVSTLTLFSKKAL